MKNKWQMFVAGALLTTVIVAPTAEASSYTVQKGDTLTKIAKAHNTTIQQLKHLNSLKNDSIYIEQTLQVATSKKPIVTKPNVAAVVKPATKAVAKPAEKAIAKSATKDTARPVAKVVAKPVAKVVAKSTAKQTTHNVVKGDTLTKIAQQYQTTVSTIKQWNNLKSDAILIGQKLSVNSSTSASKTGEIVTGQSSNETVSAEKVEAVIDFVVTEVKQADQLIARQLASEKKVISGPTAAGQATYHQVIAQAKELIGTPYIYGGNTIAGFDCSGFVNYVYKTAGVDISRKSSLNYFTQDTTQVQQPVPGDLVFFKNTYISNISHMGIYIGNDEFIHAGSRGIEVSKLNANYWNERFVAFKRLNNI